MKIILDKYNSKDIMAAKGIYIPLFTYRTGAYAGSGIPTANGMSDYFTMLNERDGGIGGIPLIVEECETGYKPNKGVECYEKVKDKKHKKYVRDLLQALKPDQLDLRHVFFYYLYKSYKTEEVLRV